MEMYSLYTSSSGTGEGGARKKNGNETRQAGERGKKSLNDNPPKCLWKNPEVK